jgi:glycosyltransferase involved in cell wall biosynthesis
MKVLNVNATLDPVAGGGTAERTFQLSRFLARGGAECAVLTLDAGLTPERAAGLGPARLVALRTVLPRFYVFALPEKRIRELVRWADVVHLMGHWTLLNAMVCREAVRQGRPYAVNPAGALPIYGRSRLLKAAYNLAIGRRMVREAHACVAIGTNEFAHFERYGVPRSRVTLIPNGVDPGISRRRIRMNSGANTICPRRPTCCSSAGSIRSRGPTSCSRRLRPSLPATLGPTSCSPVRTEACWHH